MASPRYWIRLGLGLVIALLAYFASTRLRRAAVVTPATVRRARPPKVRKAAIIALCREAEVNDMSKTIRNFDQAYNAGPRHDYIIFSDTPWSEDAQAALQLATPAIVRFYWLNEQEWGMPAWIDRSKVEAAVAAKQYYGNTISYRYMCRFFAGPVFHAPILANYAFAWRLDSHVRYLCDMPHDIDPIERMIERNATYAYTMRMTELMYTIPTLWPTVMEYAESKNLLPHLAEAWGVQEGHDASRGCHYWNNFEITRLDFFRSETYQSYFRYLDKSGGFFYERWGDAPVRTWALMLLSRPSDILEVDDIGYQHPWWYRCPIDGECRGRESCVPDPEITPQQLTDGHMCKIGD
jgi:alpha 1,2-mannosyltransferase